MVRGAARVERPISSPEIAMNRVGIPLVVAAIVVLGGCAARDHGAPLSLSDSGTDVVSSCEQSLYRPSESEDAQAALACADVLEAWR